jgi:hypothetical protein
MKILQLQKLHTAAQKRVLAERLQALLARTEDEVDQFIIKAAIRSALR